MEIPKNPWKRLSRTEQRLFDFLTLIEDQVVFPDSTTGKYSFFSMKPCVILIPEIEPGKFVMAGQWRYPTQRFSWEFPLGGVSKWCADPAEYAQDAMREGLEETGYRAHDATYLGKFCASHANNDQDTYIFYSSHLSKERTIEANDREVQKVQLFSLDEIIQMILKSEIRDGLTITALFHYLQRKT